jgi:hypothetical protein
MLPIFAVTYDVVTEESAEDGGTADSGFFHPGGWKTDADDRSEWSLKEVVSRFGRRGFEDSGSWFSSADSDIDYLTGEHTTYAIHPPRTITSASYQRLRRIFVGR